MAITVFFPEFIFSKAICELRQAVADLQCMQVAMKKRKNLLTWKDTVPARAGPDGSQVHMTVSWEADFNSRMRRLYRLLGLPALPPADEDEEKQDSTHSPVDNDEDRNSARLSDAGFKINGAPNVSRDGSRGHGFSTSRSDDRRLSSDDAPIQDKQIKHKADAVAAQPASDASGSSSVGEQALRPHAIVAPARRPELQTALDSLTPTYTTEMHTLRPEKRSDKLKYLVLDEEDIKDKSKADWLLKIIAVLQIGWLLLNACSRAANGLNVTQLEVATGALS
ncbi:hypothetical protein BELL_1260g00010 [Botrytis elliptica]|uniref:Uncharacterized protein n=1 Tax=Botrytis elliptica TaxID=278938 RepID=A0A4Z1ICH9_9HELO|nr:hypothetical protein BELL_1260g00010 [Botrytis elliptica]